MCAVRIENPDVVIVGSGVAGALMAKQLGIAGKKVVMLEAGEELPADINAYMNRFLLAKDKVPESPYPPDLFADPATINAGRPNVLTTLSFNWKDPKKAYLIQKGPLAFGSTYERINGGTARHWLGTSLRFVPSDFEMKSRFGVFTDWPVKYAELSKWYDLAEHEIGVSANTSDQGYLGITFTDGYSYPMPGIPLSLVDKFVQTAMAGFSVKGIGLDDTKWSVVGTPAARNSQPYQNRRVCAGNTNCIPICPIQAKYDPSVTLAEALRTGNVEIRYKTVASQVVVDGSGKVAGIDVITYDRDNGPPTDHARVTGKVYVIAGNAIETPRLLLMSKNEGRTPNGVANGKDKNKPGMVGKNLMDHPLYLAWALAPFPVWGYRGPLSTGGVEIARDGKFRGERGAFRVEIGNEGWNFSSLDPNTTTVDLINGLNVSGLNGEKNALFGSDLTSALNAKLSRQFRLGFLIEQSPDEKNAVGISSQFTDHLGLPRPEITYNLSDYTKRGIAAARKTASAMFRTMGATEQTTTPAASEHDPMTFEWQGERFKFYGAGHLVGTHTMGAKGSSVVDDMQKSWDHDNLYLVGSGSFPTVATANPTLTLAALCLRTADHIAKSAL